MRYLTNRVGNQVQSRSVQLDKMPFWRIREIGFGILRGILWHRAAAWKRIPIIHKDVKLRRWNGHITIGHLSEIHERVVISAVGQSAAEPAELTIGDLTTIWYGTVISVRNRVNIGRECAISWNCTIIDNDMHQLIQDETVAQSVSDGSNQVILEDHVWLGAGVTVLKGVTIGHDSVVAAGAVVTKSIPPFTLAAGVPAKPVRQLAGWR
ncbi:MAG: acyltransferase [Candidatus Promineifilaceae bacterium]